MISIAYAHENESMIKEKLLDIRGKKGLRVRIGSYEASRTEQCQGCIATEINQTACRLLGLKTSTSQKKNYNKKQEVPKYCTNYEKRL